MADAKIIKHVLEIRLKLRRFSFLDLKGQLTDEIVSKNTDFTKIKILDTRIDVANEELTEFLFFSVENFGMQIDGSLDFGEFKNKIEKLFRIVKNFNKYPIDNLIRIGTKCSVL